MFGFTEREGEVKDGVLADVAPSILKLMGVAQPEDMTGECLIDLK